MKFAFLAIVFAFSVQHCSQPAPKGKCANPQLVELKNKLPTREWKELLKQGIGPYSDAIIQGSEKLLEKFLDDLCGLGSLPKKEEVLKCVKETVIAFNELDKKYDGFIETEEREQLAEFISIAAAKTLQVELGNTDYTEPWRDW